MKNNAHGDAPAHVCCLCDPATRNAALADIGAAVVRALVQEGTIEPQTVPNPVIEVGGLRVDVSRREAWLDGQPVLGLRPREFDILAFLARHPGHAFKREQLLDLVWPMDAALTINERSVDVHMYRLRRLGVRVKAVHGIGYKFEDHA